MKIRYNTYLLSCLLGICFSGCDALLDTESKDSLPQSLIQTESGAESQIIGVYEQMQQTEFYGRSLIAIPEILADNCRLAQSASVYRNFATNEPRAHLEIWATAYAQIASANEAIESLRKLPETDNRNALLGEALFLRALNYFNLNIVYGREPGHLVDGFDLSVPVIIQPYIYTGGSILDEASPKRNKGSEVWAQIETDLNESFGLLESNDVKDVPFRAGALAAKALLSRAYLYQSKWQDCVEASDYVIANSPVAIYEGNYTDIFSEGTESIFELNFALTENLGSTSLHAYFGTFDNGKRDEEGYGDGVGPGEGELCAAEDFVALFNQNADVRFTALRKAYFGSDKVWWSTKFNSWKGTFGLDNIPLIRISEIYLNRAEALVETGSPTQALADVNALRTKRGLEEYTFSNSQDLMKEILLQRRLELAFEGHRFFDLKRRGLNILKANGKPAVPYSDYRVVAPIPETELDVNKNLIDNPGYN